MMIDRLIDKIRELNNPTVVGLDPRLDYVPEFIRSESFDEYGETAKGAAEAFLRFNRMLMDELCGVVPAVKPQIAMYEQYGADGIAAYCETVRYAKQKGFVVIGDVKRSDIASTAEAYADGHIGEVAVGSKKLRVYDTDFITLNPYLGYDSIEPYLAPCREYDRGLFVLVKTSNPNSGEIQDLICEGKTVYELVGGLVSKWGEGFIGKYGFSDIGAVVGATHAEQAKRLRELMPHTFFLVPGYGAQGGKASELAVCFNEQGLGAIVNSSRGIIGAYQKSPYREKYSDAEFAIAAREAAIAMRDDIGENIRLR